MTALDRDIADLIAWYEAHYGKPYDYADLMPDLPAQSTKDSERYPLPNSYNPTADKPKPAKVAPPSFDRAAYDQRVFDLRANGYVSIREAARIIGCNLYMLRQHVTAGHVEVIDTMGASWRGMSISRYFINQDGMARYTEWLHEKRRKPAKSA